jgi:hypothetical protein
MLNPERRFVNMASFELQQGEVILAQAQAQLAQGFPQTAGDLYLTNRRLVLEPNQFASLGFGKRWEFPLSRVVKVEKLGNFKGGSFVGSAGKKLAVSLDDSSLHTFAFYLSSNIDEFYRVLATQVSPKQ